MDAVLTVVGVVVLVIGLRDMFQTLLHPQGHGRLSGTILIAVWTLSRATGHRFGSAVGPAAMVTVILFWVLLQVLGWALIYLPHVPTGFLYSPGLNPADYPDFLQALHLSAVTLTTLGYGDVVAINPWVRAITPVEAVIGFALLTAGLTWFSQIYPPLLRRRALAQELTGLSTASYADAVPDGDPAVITRVLDTLAVQVSTVGIDFAQHCEGFYFKESIPGMSLARQVSYLLQLRDAARSSSDPLLRRSGERLAVAIEQLSSVLDENFLHCGQDTPAVFAAYAREHGQS